MLLWSKRDTGQPALRAIGAGTVDHRIALLKGCFFTEWGQPTAGPKNATKDAQGRWADASRLEDLASSFSESRWSRRDKPFWLAPLSGESLTADSDGLPHDINRPEMWSRLRQTTHGNWEEAERWFLVPTHWKDRR